VRIKDPAGRTLGRAEINMAFPNDYSAIATATRRAMEKRR